MTIQTGQDQSWSYNLQKALSAEPIANFPHVLLILDDLLLNRRVETQKILDCISALVQLSGNYLRLVPAPPPVKSLKNFLSWVCLPQDLLTGIPYRPVFGKENFSSICFKQMKSPWDFEVFGSKRSDAYPGFYCITKRVLYYINGVERGKWLAGGSGISKKRRHPHCWFSNATSFRRLN